MTAATRIPMRRRRVRAHHCPTCRCEIPAYATACTEHQTPAPTSTRTAP